MGTKVCKVCGRELPEADFRLTRWGKRGDTCRECVASAHRGTRARNRAAKIGGVGGKPISDPDFDGRTIGDVWRLMCRAQKWLESRGCKITLSGEFHETKIRKLKIE